MRVVRWMSRCERLEDDKRAGVNSCVLSCDGLLIDGYAPEAKDLDPNGTKRPKVVDSENSKSAANEGNADVESPKKT